jgi:hypothetical protein
MNTKFYKVFFYNPVNPINPTNPGSDKESTVQVCDANEAQ